MKARALGALALIAGAAFPLIGPTGAAQAATACEPGKTRYVDETPLALIRLDAPHLGKLATGKGVKVAVIDSGVAASNQHFKNAVEPGLSLVPGDHSAGRTDTFVHGTVIAGLIAARPVPGSTVIGLAPGATILPVRVYEKTAQAGDAGSGLDATTATIAKGVEWAARHGADVINISMSSERNDPALEKAVAFAIKQDAVVVAAAGNREPEDATDGPRYPAAYDGVIGVSATDVNNMVTNYSIHGPQVDVTAPGQQVLSTFLAFGDCTFGVDKAFSSYATAYVSGLAALLRQRFPEEDAAHISYRIMAGASRGNSAYADPVDGWGMIQPTESLTMLLSKSRTGPPFPGTAVSAEGQREQVIKPSADQFDPLSPARGRLGWWAVLGGGAVAVALVTRPLVTRARERR